MVLPSEKLYMNSNLLPVFFSQSQLWTVASRMGWGRDSIPGVLGEHEALHLDQVSLHSHD